MAIAVLIQIDGYDPVAASAVTIRLASLDDERVCWLNDQIWSPEIARLPTLGLDLFSGQFDGEVKTAPSSLSFSTSSFANFSRLSLSDARLQIWVGVAGAPWGEYVRRFDGRVSGQPTITAGMATLGFTVDDRWLDVPLLPLYAGTGAAEGDAQQKGNPKPLALGAPRYTGGTLVDPVKLIYQVSGFGLIDGFDAALDRLVRYPAPIADYANYAALQGAVIAAGAWATCNSLGMARFGAPPFGKVSFLVRGDKSGPDGWVRKPGDMIRRIALISGGAGKINDASLNALNTSRPHNLSLWIAEQVTGREIIQSLAASVNAVSGVNWLGGLFVAPVQIGASIVTLACDDSALPPCSEPEQVGIGAPFWRIGLAAERTWNLHGSGDYAATDLLPGNIGFENVTGDKKPSDNATRNDDGGANLLSATSDLGNAFGLNGGIVQRYPTAGGRQADRARGYFPPGETDAQIFFDNAFPMTAADDIYARHSVFVGGGANLQVDLVLLFQDGMGTSLGFTLVTGASVSAADGVGLWISKQGAVPKSLVPANTAKGVLFATRGGLAVGEMYSGEPYVSRVQPGAQVNPANLAALDGSASTKLAGIEAGAQVNPANLAALDPAAAAQLAAAMGGVLTVGINEVITKRLNNGAGASFDGAIGLNGGGVNGTVRARVEVSEDGTTWSLVAQGAGASVGPGEPGFDEVFGAAFTNSSGVAKTYKFRIIDSRTPALAGGMVIPAESFLRG